MTRKEILYIYTRVSTEEQLLRDYSPKRQRELGIAKAKELGLRYEIFEEGGESASHENFDNRPKLFELLRLVNEGIAKHIFVFDQSRLSRNDITKAVITQSLIKRKAQLYTASKKFDFQKAEDSLTFKILEAIESYESALRKARFQLGYVSANKTGRFLKGIPPYGYKKDKDGFLIVDVEEKKVFLKIVAKYLSGLGTNQIATWLNEQKIPTKTSKVLKKGYILKDNVSNRKSTNHVLENEWNPGVINGMLKHELYVGRRKFKVGNNEYEYVACEALIDRETFDKIQTIRAANAITKKKQDKYFYLLKDLLQCGNCGQPMHGRVKPNRGEFSYICNSKRRPKSNCTSRGINIDKLNAVVWNAVATSAFYHKQINARIITQLDDSSSLIKRAKELETEYQNLEKQEAKIVAKKKSALRHSLDGRLRGVFEEVLDEIQKEQDLIANNKLTCLTNIKQLNESINNKRKAKSELQKGLDLFHTAQKEFSRIDPPFKTKELQLKATQFLKEAIQNVRVEYLPQKKQHRIQLSFQKIGIKKNFMDEKPYKYSSIKNLTKTVSTAAKVDYFKREIDSDIKMLNDDPDVIKAHGQLGKWQDKKRKNQKVLPPLLILLPTLHSLVAEAILIPEKFHWRITVFYF